MILFWMEMDEECQQAKRCINCKSHGFKNIFQRENRIRLHKKSRELEEVIDKLKPRKVSKTENLRNTDIFLFK